MAVESNPAAARDLEANTSGRVARSGRVIEVRTADVEEFLAKIKEKPELVVLDPPRAGLTPGTIKHLARTGARAHHIRFLRSADARARSRRVRKGRLRNFQTFTCSIFFPRHFTWRRWYASAGAHETCPCCGSRRRSLPASGLRARGRIALAVDCIVAALPIFVSGILLWRAVPHGGVDTSRWSRGWLLARWLRASSAPLFPQITSRV